MLIVTCAIIIHDHKILICQRSSTMNLPLRWEFPGGKVEPGEDEGATIVREIKEELHLEIEVVKPLRFDTRHVKNTSYLRRIRLFLT